MKIKELVLIGLTCFSANVIADTKTPEEICQYFGMEIPELAREGKAMGLSARLALDSMQKDYLHLKGQGKVDGLMEMWAWAVNRSYESSQDIEELKQELYVECLAMDLTQEKLKVGINAVGFDLSYANDSWDLNVVEDKFTGNRVCEIYTRFMRDNESGRPLRTLIIPFGGKQLNQQGDFIERNYEIGVASGVDVYSGLQLLVDNQRVSLDSDRSGALDALHKGKHLQIRYTFPLLGSTHQERHSLTLEGFSSAWQRAENTCTKS